MTTRSFFAVLIFVLSALPCFAQKAIPVGKGSYAEFPPPDAPDNLGKIESQKLYLVKEDDRPIPTNKWWTQLVVSRFAKSLWAYPLRADTGENGVDLFFPTHWAPEGNDPACDFPLTVGGKDFKPADSRAKDWSDWTVSFRMGESNEKFMDVTLGEGQPYAWFEYHGVQPTVTFPPGVTPSFFDRSGRKTGPAVSGDCIGIEYQSRHFGLFAPDGTRFTGDEHQLTLTFAGKSQFLVICPLPATSDLEYFHRYAYAIPRDTQMSWKYEPEKGLVTTTWRITTELLKGSEHKIIQGWIPHHYRNTVNNLPFGKIEYLSPRGRMRCAVGNEFVIGFPYTGIVPNLPAPQQVAGLHPYDPARMHAYLADVAANPKFGADTYWGGKDLLRFGQCALMAQQTNDPALPVFRDSLRGALADWYTYQPGKKEHFFVRYPHWKALIGVKTSYGSEGFNDQHFHYGYFTFATALLAMHDRAFLDEYGEMSQLVAKEYANWDRKDQRFPFLRTFDLWAGHSWAAGTSSPGGQNQESSSEAVQSWAGLTFLGQAINDPQMTATGAMGYAIETAATMEYWFNAYGDVFPPEWKHKVTGMVWGGGKVFGTYFTGDPAWIYGINWLPASPMLSYLARDPAFARQSYANMVKDYGQHEAADAAEALKKGAPPHEVRQPTIETFGPALGSVMLGYVLMYDPDWTAGQLDSLWNQPGDKVAHDAGEMTIMYYMAHSMQSLGRVDWTSYTSSPTSTVYINDKTGARHILIWNPHAKSETVNVWETDKPAGKVVAGPQALTSKTSPTLSPAK